MVSTPQRRRHRKDAPVIEQRDLSAAADRLARALDEISVRAGADLFDLAWGQNVKSPCKKMRLLHATQGRGNLSDTLIQQIQTLIYAKLRGSESFLPPLL